MDLGEHLLRRLLKSKEALDRKRLKSSDMTSQWIYDWVAGWTKEMESSAKNQLKNAVRVKETPELHRDFNDKLVDNGFPDLAREIMIIEQGQETNDGIIKTIKDNVVMLKMR